MPDRLIDAMSLGTKTFSQTNPLLAECAGFCGLEFESRGIKGLELEYARKLGNKA